MPKLIEYIDSKLVIDFSLLPEGYELNIRVAGKMDAPSIEVQFKSNPTFMRHGSWADQINKKLKDLPGARLDD